MLVSFFSATALLKVLLTCWHIDIRSWQESFSTSPARAPAKFRKQLKNGKKKKQKRVCHLGSFGIAMSSSNNLKLQRISSVISHLQLSNNLRIRCKLKLYQGVITNTKIEKNKGFVSHLGSFRTSKSNRKILRL